MMKRLKRIFAVVAAVAMMATSAMAADSPVKPGTTPAPTTTITAEKTTTTMSTKTKEFNLGIKVENGDAAKVTYTSDSKKVKVDAEGNVTISKKFVGIANITVKVGDVEKVIPVTVKPAKVASPKAKKTSDTKAKVTWKKSTSVSGYEVQYSTKKTMKSAKKATVKKAKTTSKTLKLKKGKTYYVRVRSYKTVNGKKIYSKWTTKKVVKM